VLNSDASKVRWRRKATSANEATGEEEVLCEPFGSDGKPAKTQLKEGITMRDTWT
jgi:hypothetical protein